MYREARALPRSPSPQVVYPVTNKHAWGTSAPLLDTLHIFVLASLSPLLPPSVALPAQV